MSEQHRFGTHLVWAARRYWWMLNPSRAVWCNDLSCKCKTCTVDGCGCWEARRG